MTDIEVVQIDFLDTFREEYQRNNKAKGRKHLRCFPQCRTGGHVDNNYCGRPVQIVVTYRAASGHSGPKTVPELVSFVEFRPFDQRPAIVLGDSTPQVGEHWIPGSVISSTQIAGPESDLHKTVISFNSEHKCWPYLWQSHKMTANTPHVMDCFIGFISDGHYFNCRGISHSPKFRIFCRKKTKTKAHALLLLGKDDQMQQSQQYSHQNPVPFNQTSHRHNGQIFVPHGRAHGGGPPAQQQQHMLYGKRQYGQQSMPSPHSVQQGSQASNILRSLQHPVAIHQKPNLMPTLSQLMETRNPTLPVPSVMHPPLPLKLGAKVQAKQASNRSNNIPSILSLLSNSRNQRPLETSVNAPKIPAALQKLSIPGNYQTYTYPSASSTSVSSTPPEHPQQSNAGSSSCSCQGCSFAGSRSNEPGSNDSMPSRYTATAQANPAAGQKRQRAVEQTDNQPADAKKAKQSPSAGQKAKEEFNAAAVLAGFGMLKKARQRQPPSNQPAKLHYV